MILDNKQQMQEIFDRVAIHLLIQDKHSKSRNGCCRYRGVADTSCSVGCLIDEKRYQERFEGYGVRRDGVGIKQAVELSLDLSLGQKEVELLHSLQMLHDQNNPPLWCAGLCLLADHFELDKSAIDFVLAYTNKVTK